FNSVWLYKKRSYLKVVSFCSNIVLLTTTKGPLLAQGGRTALKVRYERKADVKASYAACCKNKKREISGIDLLKGSISDG
ncbi:hypothetical protein, partial [Pantoea ananatis]|uniref:hypothetical protein n=1 Tax=Pantoea ananas TaxID=553 RepID=UPI0021F6E027